jgi:hypothetical protein
VDNFGDNPHKKLLKIMFFGISAPKFRRWPIVGNRTGDGGAAMALAASHAKAITRRGLALEGDAMTTKRTFDPGSPSGGRRKICDPVAFAPDSQVADSAIASHFVAGPFRSVGPVGAARFERAAGRRQEEGAYPPNN